MKKDDAQSVSKESTAQSVSKEDKINVVVGLLVVLAVFAVFTAVIVMAGNSRAGEIAYAGEAMRGSEQQFSYKPKNLKKGDTVTWFVDNQKMATYRYDGGDINFNYTPTKVGNSTVRVVAGRNNQSKTFFVGKPTLNITAKDMQITYGENIPQPEFTCEGLVCGDTEDCLNCQIECKTDKAACGTYQITLDATCDDYEICCKGGTLTVLPREITIKNGFEKVYDQTTAINSSNLQLDGVLEGDDVCAKGENLCFESKNVGTYKVNTQNVTLSGKDAANYVLCNQAEGKIVPKEISLQGLTVADKTYDGTTKARISKMGTLKGVCEGDSVAVGSLDVSFDGANIGTQKVTVKNVKLVGYDKDNYTVKDVSVNDANISK